MAACPRRMAHRNDRSSRAAGPAGSSVRPTVRHAAALAKSSRRRRNPPGHVMPAAGRDVFAAKPGTDLDATRPRGTRDHRPGWMRFIWSNCGAWQWSQTDDAHASPPPCCGVCRRSGGYHLLRSRLYLHARAAHARARAGDGLHHDRRLGDAQARAAIGLGDAHAEPAVGRDRLIEGVGEATFLVELQPILVGESVADAPDTLADVRRTSFEQVQEAYDCASICLLSPTWIVRGFMRSGRLRLARRMPAP